MRKILIALLILTSFSCKKFIAEEEITAKNNSSVQAEVSGNWVGDPNRTPDIKPIQYEIWPYVGPYGVRASNYGLPEVRLNTTNYFGEIGNWLRYLCPIANDGVPSSAFYSPLLYNPNDGKYSKTDFIYKAPVTNPDFLYRVVFQNGLPVSYDNYKQRWEGRDGDQSPTYNYLIDNAFYLRYYEYGDTSVLHPQYADLYFNDVRLPNNPSGKYVTVITVNQENYITHNRVFNEARYDNNTVTLPVSISGTSVVVDESALVENQPHPINSFFLPVFTGHGANRTVKISWDCPYHEYEGVVHKFTIKKNGITVATKQWGDSYTDKVGAKIKQPITYEVFIEIEGLGTSIGKSIIVR